MNTVPTCARALLRVAGYLILAALPVSTAVAQLTDSRITVNFNELELQAAQANQLTYDLLLPVCGPQADGTCTAEVFQVFSRAQEFVQTANELLANGPTEFSLRLDQTGLGRALRWTAAEELAAQGSMATDFANNQLASLASRVNALRFAGSRLSGGGASADDSGLLQRWGGFFDGGYGWGKKEPTALEDAFDFDGQEISLGLDRRFGDQYVLGVLLGYTGQRIDFDSSQSVVDGDIESDGFSAIVYGLWETDQFYLSASLGGQWLNYDIRRRITYPSQNPNVASVDETALSDTDSQGITATINAGYEWRRGGFSVSPFFRADYQDLTIDAFSEGNSAGGFDLAVAKQSIQSTDVGLGVAVRYVFTPRFGVLVPFLRGEAHKQFEDGARTIVSGYQGALPAFSAGNAFSIPTDPRDDQYLVLAVGISSVLPRGLQLFAQYSQVTSLDLYDDRVIAGGIRMEF